MFSGSTKQISEASHQTLRVTQAAALTMCRPNHQDDSSRPFGIVRQKLFRCQSKRW